MNNWPAVMRSMRNGAIALCLALSLTNCATLSPVPLAPTRVIVACPEALVYQPDRSLPAAPATNEQLKEFSHRLLDRLIAGWNEADSIAAQCSQWLREQQDAETEIPHHP